jgi:DNA sulfur modification protein DndD
MNFLRLLESESPTPKGIGEIVDALLVQRAALANAGNRRVLYARIDDLLKAGVDHDDDFATSQTSLRLSDDRPSIRLTAIRLRHWKSFEKAELRFPSANDGRPLFIVGGENGFGKSSLLEAFAFGLFGRRALSEIGFLIHGTGGRNALRRSYSLMLERILHRSDRARTEGTCAVTLSFDTADGPVEVERKWYFDERGSLIEDDEELFLRQGRDRHLVEAPDGVDLAEWRQREIERLIMPAGLAPFFVFDGEQIERWAERQLSDQVRSAVQRMLGLDALAGLIDDLRDFAKDRERAVGPEDAAANEELREHVEEIERRISADEAELHALHDEIRDDRTARDAGVARLAVANASTHADLQVMLEQRHRMEAEQARLKRELVGIVADHGPLTLVGGRLLHEVADEIEAEGHQSAAMQIDRANFDALWQRFAMVKPALDKSVALAMRSRLEKAWSSTASDDFPPIVHGHIAGSDHRAVAGRLRGAASNGLLNAAMVLNQLVELRQAMTALDNTEAERLRDAALRDELRTELGQIAARMEAREAQRHEIQRRLLAAEADLRPARGELERRLARVIATGPKARSAVAARAVAAALDARMADAAKAEYAKFAAAVTRNFRALAHKDQISRIDISQQGAIALFDRHGQDLTDYRLSAGESQLFAMSLIAAVGDLTGSELPLIVDTPLGRLDTKHREHVLDMLMRRSAQTILLTQPEEVNDQHFARLKPVIAGSVRIEHRLSPVTNVGVSTFVDGYGGGA